MECNDLPLYMRHGNPPRVMLEIFQDWLDYARKYEQGASRIDPTIHSHVFGRPVGMSVFQRMIDVAKQADDIWIGDALRGGEVHLGAAERRVCARGALAPHTTAARKSRRDDHAWSAFCMSTLYLAVLTQTNCAAQQFPSNT